jgi:AcrR family transcriptional regulator
MRVADEDTAEAGGAEVPVRRRGRPLDPAREDAILTATWALLGEQGYDQMTVKDVAGRAGAGLGAIYRRWPTKVDLTIAAVQANIGVPLPRPTGDVEVDLARLMTAEIQRMTRNLNRIAGFVSALRHDPDLACAVRAAILEPTMRAYTDVLAPVCVDALECRLRAESAVGHTFYRVLMADDPPTRTEIRRYLVPLVLGRPLAVPDRSPAGRTVRSSA